jgi:hypothetical protein
LTNRQGHYNRDIMFCCFYEELIFRHFRNDFEKKVHVAMSVCLFACNNLRNGFSQNFILGSFTKICSHIPIFVKIEQQ